MPVTDDQVAALRALLEGKRDEYQQRLGRLERDDANVGFAALIAAGFFEAVDRRFVRKGVTRGDVIKFVGDVRARSADVGRELDVHAAERLIFHSLGLEPSVADLDDRTVMGTQLVLLGVLVAEEQLNGTELEKFIGKVRSVADEWTT